MSGKTGQKCQQSGIYKCSTHAGYTISLSKGETFPPCKEGKDHGAIWVLVREA